MDSDVFTIGFARRAATYKRADLLFSDIERLEAIATQHGGLQIVYAGKAHPQDEAGKEQIQRIFHARDLLRDKIKIAYLTNYSMEIGKMMTAGVEVWLNTPQPPMEASGTSGMKAAVNGVPSFSVLDGWWIEGCIEGVTGWSIGPPDGLASELQIIATMRRRFTTSSGRSSCRSITTIETASWMLCGTRSRSMVRFSTHTACCSNTY